MKVYIGPYKNWIGPYQIAEKILFWRDKEDDSVHEFGEFLAKSNLLVDICEYIHSKRNRKINVRIDNYDTWSMDHTLAYIVVPMLKQLKEKTHGAPFIHDEDVPEHLRKSTAPPTKYEWDTDENYFKRWEWVMNEMIFAFESKVTEWDENVNCNFEDRLVVEARIQNGFVLFGKYYQGLWD